MHKKLKAPQSRNQVHKLKPGNHQLSHAITDFFSVAGVAVYRQVISDSFLAASSPHSYKAQTPANLLTYFHHLLIFMNGVHRFIQQNNGKHTVPHFTRTLNKNHCNINNNSGNVQRNCYHTLSADEYNNPYLAFTRFFAFQGPKIWKADLGTILETALSENDLVCSGIEHKLLAMYFHLVKLVEAAHVFRSLNLPDDNLYVVPDLKTTR